MYQGRSTSGGTFCGMQFRSHLWHPSQPTGMVSCTSIERHLVSQRRLLPGHTAFMGVAAPYDFPYGKRHTASTNLRAHPVIARSTANSPTHLLTPNSRALVCVSGAHRRINIGQDTERHAREAARVPRHEMHEKLRRAELSRCVECSLCMSECGAMKHMRVASQEGLRCAPSSHSRLRWVVHCKPYRIVDTIGVETIVRDSLACTSIGNMMMMHLHYCHSKVWYTCMCWT